LLNSLYALCDLAQDDVWPLGRWRDALQAWSEERMVKRSWRYAAPLVQRMPDATIQELAHVVTWWIEAASKSITGQEDILLDLCRRVLFLPLEPGADDAKWRTDGSACYRSHQSSDRAHHAGTD
jgi:hypothetical protein